MIIGGVIMALIQCPECHKEVSEKANVCIHCGYPLKKDKNTKCIVNGKEYDLSFILDDEYSILFKVRDFIQITHCEIGKAREIVEKIINEGEIPKTLFVPIATQQSKQPKCPHCNSTNIKPITTGERIGSITMLGIFSKKINKSFKCLDCKYTW